VADRSRASEKRRQSCCPPIPSASHNLGNAAATNRASARGAWDCFGIWQRCVRVDALFDFVHVSLSNGRAWSVSIAPTDAASSHRKAGARIWVGWIVSAPRCWECSQRSWCGAGDRSGLDCGHRNRPAFSQSASQHQSFMHVFEPLVDQDARQIPCPRW